MASSSWSGAIEVSGFPVKVKLYGRVKSRSGESFKQLDPKHKQPIHTVCLDIKEKQVERPSLLKGIERAKGEWVALTDKQVASIAEGERSKMLQAEAFVPLSSVDLSLAMQTYVVRPEDEVMANSVNTLWNGLRAQDIAYVTRLVFKAGSRDSILVLYASDKELLAATLPFEAELQDDLPDFEFTVNDAQADVFRIMVGDEIVPFEHSSFESKWRSRRNAVIESVLSGKPVEVPKLEPEEQEPVMDLMAALEKQATAKAKGKKKAAPKAKAA